MPDGMTLGGDVEIEPDRGGLMIQLAETQGRLTNLRNARRRDENLNETLFYTAMQSGKTSETR